MSTSQVLDRTFYLYRKNWVLFAGIAIVGPGLSLIASLIQLGMFGVPAMPTPQPGQFDPALFQSMMQNLIVQGVVGAILGLIFYTIGQALATGATMHAVSMVHLGDAATIAGSYRAIKPIFWRILRILVSIYIRGFWPVALGYVLMLVIFLTVLRSLGAGAPQIGTVVASMLMFLVLFVAVFGGLIWAVYVYCRYSLAIPACAIENLTAPQSMARSKFLVAGSFGKILGIYALTFVMSVILTSVLQLPAYFSTNVFSLKPGTQVTVAFVFWSQLGGFLGRTLAGPIATIAIALVYYDQRVRKEAFDLQLMMAAIGPSTPPPPPFSIPAAPGQG